MPRRSRKLKKLGEFFEVNFRVSIGVATASSIFVVVATLLFANQLVDREVLKFLAVAVGTATAVTSAVYVGDGIRQNLALQKTNRTLAFISEWVDPKFLACNEAARKIRQEIESQPHDLQIETLKRMLREDAVLEDRIVAILNYLESVALAVEEESVDEEIIREYFIVIFRRFCQVYGVWIAERRNQRGSEIYSSLTRVSERWNQEFPRRNGNNH